MIDEYIYWQSESAPALLVSPAAPPASGCHPSLAPSSFHPFFLIPFCCDRTHTHNCCCLYPPHTPLQHIGLGKLLFERAYLSCLIAYLRAGCVIELLGLISCKHSRLFLYWRASPLTSPPPPTPCVLVLFFFSNTPPAWRKDATNAPFAAHLDTITAAFCRCTCCSR